MKKSRNLPERIAGGYAVVGFLWIWGSDQLARYLLEESRWFPFIQMVKGWGFVAATTFFLYWIVRRYLGEADLTRRSLEQEHSERVRLEESLLASRRDLRDITFALDQSTIVAITDKHGIITDVNDNFCSISKYSRDELIGKDHRVVNSGLHSKAFFAEMWTKILSGVVWNGQIRNRAKDSSHYWVDTTIVPFIGVDGKPYQYMAIRHDITDRKLAEDRLREQESLARLGEMAAVIAHEVKNPLAGISGAIQIIGARLPEESRERKIVGDIIERIEGLNARIQDMLLFARPRPPHPVPIPVKELLRSSAEHVGSSAEFSKIEVDIQTEDVTVMADPAMMKEVLLNLLINAAQAMNGQGRVMITAARHGDRHCRIEVVDSGPGVPPEMEDRLFAPFVTTKHKGTGLGLPIARRVVRDHGGEIELVNRPAPGACFAILLPLSGRTN